jgi:alpha-L-fucosidase 2
VALAAVRAREDTRVAAVVPFYAPVDQEADMRRRGGLSASMKALFGLTEVNEEALRVLREASPINFVRAGLPPFLLVHGTGDPSVPYDQSTRMQAKLRAAGVQADLISIDGGPHGMARWETLDPGYKQRVVAWLAQRLGASAAPAR